MELNQKWMEFIVDTEIKRDIENLGNRGRINGEEVLNLIQKYSLLFAENLKTLSNKDFTAQSVSPKVCPSCVREMLIRKEHYYCTTKGCRNYGLPQGKPS